MVTLFGNLVKSLMKILIITTHDFAMSDPHILTSSPSLSNILSELLLFLLL